MLRPVDDTHALEAILRSLLVAGAGEPPLSTALALSKQGPAALDELGELANDRRLSPLQRATVLLALSIVVSTYPGQRLPVSALDAIENAETATAAIRAGLGAALTSVLDAAGDEPSIRATRRMLARQLVAAGEVGPHVVELLVTAGEIDRAAEIAAVDLSRHLASDAAPSTETWARLRLLVDAPDPTFLDAIIARVPAVLLDVLDRLLPALPGADPKRVARARSAIVWARGR